MVGSDIAWIKLASELNQLINLQFFEVGANLCSYKYHTVHILVNAGTFITYKMCMVSWTRDRSFFFNFVCFYIHTLVSEPWR